MAATRNHRTAPSDGARRLHPVQVEVILIRYDDAPSGSLAYRVVQGPLPDGATPDTTAAGLCAGAASDGPAAASGDPGVSVLHSTSWRHDPALGVVLTYAALPDPRPDLPAVALRAPSVVCSGDPLRSAPDVLHDHHVAAHAVRHLAYLLDHDPGIAATARRPRLAVLWRAMRDAAAAMPTAPHAQAHHSAERAATRPGIRPAS